MALIVGEWHFRGPPPGLAAVAERLGAATGLAVVVEGGGERVALALPLLRERLFDWTVEDGRIAVAGFAPAHPYVWENLDRVLTEAGGTRAGAPHLWRPDPRLAWLRCAWSALGPWPRLLLRLPTLGASRPWDALLRRG